MGDDAVRGGRGPRLRGCPTRRSRGRCASGGCGHGATTARRRGRRRSSPSSITRRARRPSGTGSSCGPARLVGLGQARAPAGRRAVVLGRVACGARGVGGAAVPGRVDPRRSASGWAGVGHPPVAVRSHVHGLPPGDRRPSDGVVRRGREVLRRRRRCLPVAPRLAQGRSGEGEPLRRAAVVADAAQRRHPGAGPGAAGRLVHPGGRRAPPGPGRGADDGRRADGFEGKFLLRRCRSRGPGGQAGWCRRRRWCAGTGTPTPSRPATAGRR